MNSRSILNISTKHSAQYQKLRGGASAVQSPSQSNQTSNSVADMGDIKQLVIPLHYVIMKIRKSSMSIMSLKLQELTVSVSDAENMLKVAEEREKMLMEDMYVKHTLFFDILMHLLK